MILEKIAVSARKRVEAGKKARSLEEMRRLAEEAARRDQGEAFTFERTLSKPGIHFICEVKKASPSKGVIAGDFPYMEIAADYEKAGADCISVLTEPDYFLGRDEYLSKIREKVRIPILRKDFTIDEYQIYEAKVLGADCVLLICSLLTEQELKRFLEIASGLGLSALVEAHDGREVEIALTAGCRILGVNNRNLRTFEVDVSNSRELRSLVPDSVLYIAESGIETREDVRILEEAGVDGVLVGETLMRSADRGRTLQWLRGAAGGEKESR